MTARPGIVGVGAEQAAIEHHYDVGNDFYALWLDASMSYSCALWTGDESLETAQRRKLEHHREQLRLPPGGRLLDVGCGWGAMLDHVHRADPDAELVGLTLSPAQADGARDRIGAAAEVHVQAWQEHDPEAPYDGIVSLGAFEHFVRPGLDRAARISGYQSFFAACARWLAEPSSRLSLQTIALEDQEELIGSDLDTFFTSAVFPDSSLPRIGEIVAAAEPHLRLVALRADPDDYARTCNAWRRRLVARRAAALDTVDAATFRHYRKMLFASEVLFAARATTLYRLTFERRTVEVSVERGRAAGDP